MVVWPEKVRDIIIFVTENCMTGNIKETKVTETAVSEIVISETVISETAVSIILKIRYFSYIGSTQFAGSPMIAGYAQ
jgi:hypothetical protein